MENIKHIQSIAIITSAETLQGNIEDAYRFYDYFSTTKKDLIIYTTHPISDYTSIKKVSASELTVLYSKDFLPLNIGLKPNVRSVLKSKEYQVLVHFDFSPKCYKNSLLIAKAIRAQIKITSYNNKVFNVVLKNHSSAAEYLSAVLKYLNKLL